MFCSLTKHFNEAYNLNLGSVQLFNSSKLFTFVETCQQLRSNSFFFSFSPAYFLPLGSMPKLLISFESTLVAYDIIGWLFLAQLWHT